MEKMAFNTEGEWLEARRSSLGGSDAPIIAGVSPYVSPLELYCEKTGIVELDDSIDNEPMEWGKLLEPIVAQVYAEKTGRPLIDHGFNMFRGNFGFPTHASLDREIAPVHGHLNKGPGVLQVKTTAKYSMNQLQEDLPLDWQVQMQHEIANAGFSWGSFAILMVHSRKLGWIDVERNDSFIEVLVEQERRFWQRIVDRDPPEPDGSDSAVKTLKALYPKDSGASIPLPAEAIEWDIQLERAKAECAHWEKRKKEMENNLKAAIGEATYGVLPGGVKYSWRLQHRDGFSVKPTEFRVLRRVS